MNDNLATSALLVKYSIGVILTVSIILVVIITMEIWSFVAIILGGKANENY